MMAGFNARKRASFGIDLSKSASRPRAATNLETLLTKTN